MGLQELKEKLAQLEANRRKLDHEIMNLKREVIKAQREEFKETGFTDSLPVTANDWQLYTTSMKCDGCAKRLTARLKKELERFAKQAHKVGVKEATKDCYNRMMAKLDQESKYGAADTEPRGVMAQAILDHGRMLGFAMDPEWVW